MYSYKEMQEVIEHWKLSLMWHQLIIIVLMVTSVLLLIS
jgi:hypothetical protein